MVKIKVTAGELLAVNDALQKLLTCEMPVKSGFQVMRLIKQLGPNMEAAVTSRNKVIDKYGKVDKQGNSQVPPERMKDAMPLLLEIAAIECDIEFEEISLPGDVTLDVVTLVALEKFVVLQ